jgi:hypothetical protein
MVCTYLGARSARYEISQNPVAGTQIFANHCLTGWFTSET